MTANVMLVSCVLHQLPATVWDDMDFEDLRPVLEAQARLNGHGEDDTKESKTEGLHDFDRAQMRVMREEYAQRGGNTQ